MSPHFRLTSMILQPVTLIESADFSVATHVICTSFRLVNDFIVLNVIESPKHVITKFKKAEK